MSILTWPCLPVSVCPSNPHTVTREQLNEFARNLILRIISLSIYISEKYFEQNLLRKIKLAFYIVHDSRKS